MVSSTATAGQAPKSDRGAARAALSQPIEAAMNDTVELGLPRVTEPVLRTRTNDPPVCNVDLLVIHNIGLPGEFGVAMYRRSLLQLPRSQAHTISPKSPTSKSRHLLIRRDGSDRTAEPACLAHGSVNLRRA